MNTSDTRVTRAQAAKLMGVSMRQINRWSAAGLLTVHHGPPGTAAMYETSELLALRERREAGGLQAD